VNIPAVNSWIYNERPGGVRFLTQRIAEPDRSEIEAEIWTRIVRGEDDAGDFLDYLDDEEERHGATEEELRAAYENALAARREQQRAWGEVRSNLNRAFAELNERGVLARENFACCGTCAAAEIHDERDDSRHWHGYVWYHQQDTDALIDSEEGAVYLGYGIYPPADFDEFTHAALPEAEQQACWQADLERLLDEIVFPVLRARDAGGMEPSAVQPDPGDRRPVVRAGEPVRRRGRLTGPPRSPGAPTPGRLRCRAVLGEARRRPVHRREVRSSPRRRPSAPSASAAGGGPISGRVSPRRRVWIAGRRSCRAAAPRKSVSGDRNTR